MRDLKVSQQSCRLISVHKIFGFILIEFVVISMLVFEKLSFVLDCYRTEWYSLLYCLFSMKIMFSTLKCVVLVISRDYKFSF
jgi:hypothetical protein